MFFIDSINLYVASGKGGNGSVSFYKSIYDFYKRPDGGNGGKGGNVFFIGDKELKTFSKLKSNLNYKAQDGENGQSNRKTGRNGCDLFIHVPLGTVIYDIERNIFFGEILNDGDLLLVLKGGRAGYGNFFLKSCEKGVFDKLIAGGVSKIMHCHLELKLLSDVGLLGFPNVGKSLFINKISNVISKVADYSFTTLNPVLGVINLNYFNDIVVADLPGIIKKSHLGVGLGFNFLKHLLKTRLLLHVIDSTSIYSKISLLRELVIINNELKKYNVDLFKIEKWIVFNKIDLIRDFKVDLIDRKYLLKFNYTNIFLISSKESIGLKKLCFNICEFFSFYNKVV